MEKIEEKKQSAQTVIEKQVDDVECEYEIWESMMEKLFSINLIEKLTGLCQVPKEAKDRVAYLYEAQISNARNGLRRRLKAMATKYNFMKVFSESHEVLDYNFLIAELSKLDTGFTEEEL